MIADLPEETRGAGILAEGRGASRGGLGREQLRLQDLVTPEVEERAVVPFPEGNWANFF
jgi:hypothetical protein